MKQFIFGIFLFSFILNACKQVPVGEWQNMFDGESLTGWETALENPESFVV